MAHPRLVRPFATSFGDAEVKTMTMEGAHPMAMRLSGERAIWALHKSFIRLDASTAIHSRPLVVEG